MTPFPPPLLTIAIPTYNRPVQLKRCLEALVPQLNIDCWLHIADNHSPEPAAESAVPILELHGFKQFSIVRHPYNKGAHTNIIQCFETSTTAWVWVLGDDDVVCEEAVQNVLAKIKSEQSAVAIVGALVAGNDLGLEMPKKDIVLDSLEQYFASPALFCSGLISSLIVRQSVIRSYLDTAVSYASSFYPHVAIIIACMQAEPASILFLHSPIVTYVGDGYVGDGVQEVDPSPVYKNLRYLTRLLRNDGDRAALMKSFHVRFHTTSLHRRLKKPGFIVITLATAFRHRLEARSVLRLCRRQCAEGLEFDNIATLIPWSGIALLFQFISSITFGILLGPLIRLAFLFKSKRRGLHFPTILLKYGQPLLP
jgi:glycosyltransferase involved in cell wall biosynthesis